MAQLQGNTCMHVLSCVPGYMKGPSEELGTEEEGFSIMVMRMLL
jgi:hypothetical protein